jgi:N-acetylglucosaminyl-diphospho-decaprenol L-rhamnosyltransferase
LKTSRGGNALMLSGLAEKAHSEPPEEPDVSIIVVTHEAAGCIAECLDSVRRHPPSGRWELVVVDNASEDGTVELVRSAFPEAQLTVAKRRQGFAANCNQGAALATGEHLFFLNPDARVTASVIDQLLEVLRADRNVGLVGPRLVYPDGRPQPSARRFPTVSATLLRRTPLRMIVRDSFSERRHLMLDRRDGQTAAPGLTLPVDWLLGAAVAMRADVYRELGGMDASFRLYCEDIDLCWRVWSSGRRVVQLQTSVAEHELGELTRKKFLTRATWWHYSSMLRFVMKHGLRPPTGDLLEPYEDSGSALPEPARGRAAITPGG